jgi:hypothetical protein
MPKRAVTLSGKPLTLDARPDRIDLRDLPYRPPVASLAAVYPSAEEITEYFPRYEEAQLILDQGKEGACTGFGLACVINYLLWRRSGFSMTREDKVSPRMLYQLARFYDEWPGEDYEGSSCRGALKGWHRHGVCVEKLWPYTSTFERPSEGWDEDALSRPLGVYYRINRQSVVDIQAAIYHTGAVYVSANVHDGWGLGSFPKALSHQELPVIKYTNKSVVRGGHAFGLVGYNDKGFIVQNSWGKDWGASGFAIMSYADWVENGTDAWVVALGAPVVQKGTSRSRTAPRQYFVSSVGSATTIGFSRDPLEGRDDVWSEKDAYWHSLVTGNDGNIINRLPHVENEQDNAAFVCREQPLTWLKQENQAKWRVVVYAHGGLNSETESIERIRVLGPTFKANGIYPIFTTWRSGWLETIGQMLKDGANKLFGAEAPPVRGLGDFLVEASDRALEIFCRNVLVKSMWSEMKENVARGMNSGRGVDTIATELANLQQDSEGKLEVHLLGHSAGSFVCGRLLSELSQRNITVKSCTLLAPACDLNFALKHYKPAIDGGRLERENFRIHALSEQLEQDDSVGPYRKSLLYLVSRALERMHKTPLLGMATAYDSAFASKEYWHTDSVKQIQDWQSFFWNGSVPKNFASKGNHLEGARLTLLHKVQVNTGRRKIKSSHGCFDNDIDTMNNILGYILPEGPLHKFRNLDY